MKKYFLITCLLVALAGINGCKQDFDITADYEEVPVVYGLFNYKENTHYLRIQKGFLYEGDAYVAAAVSDSIYYTDSLLVQFKTTGNNPTVYTLQRIDGNTVSLPKEQGAFASTPNVLYTFTANLNPDKEYLLEITNTASGKKITLKKNSDNSYLRLVKDFTIAVPFKAQKIVLRNTNPAKVSFFTAQNAGIYDLKIRFPYKEYNATTNALVKDTFIDFFLFRSRTVTDIIGGASVTNDIPANTLINSLKNSIGSCSDCYREFNVAVGMTFFFSAGGVELANYITSQQVQASGLGSNEALPPYTNIDGGYGLVSSRNYQQVDSVLLNNDALDTLACSPQANGLRFKGSFGQLCD